MASPALSYASPSEGHTPIGSPAPSQILLHRVASPNHLASHQYVESPRSVPHDYSQYPTPTETHGPVAFDHPTPELYANDDPHIYDYPLPVDPQFVHQQISPQDAHPMMFMQQPALQIQPPTPMHGQFGNHIHPQVIRDSMTPFSDTASEYSLDDGQEGLHLVDISTSGFAIPTSHYMPLPRSHPMHPMQGRTFYESPVFEDEEYERSPSPGGREQVKRPLNAFMLYRKDKQTEIPTSNHQSVSRIIGAMWKSESADIKAKYNGLAQKERERHRQLYPGYKYSPKKRINKDKKVRRTMSQAAHVKRQEEEKAILRQLNKRAKSEGSFARPLPEFLPLPKSKQNSLVDDKRKAKTPVPESAPRMVQQIPRSHSAQPPSAQDYSKFTSNPSPQLNLNEEPEEALNIPQGFQMMSHMPEHYDFSYPLDYSHIQQNGTASTDANFDSDTDSFSREFSAAPDDLDCSPDEYTPFEESQLYGSFATHEDIEIFRMNSPFAVEQKSSEFDPRNNNPRVTNIFSEHWSRESTVNPQALLAQPDNE